MKKEYIAPAAVTMDFVAHNMLAVSLSKGNDINNPTTGDEAESNNREEFIFEW